MDIFIIQIIISKKFKYFFIFGTNLLFTIILLKKADKNGKSKGDYILLI